MDMDHQNPGGFAAIAHAFIETHGLDKLVVALHKPNPQFRDIARAPLQPVRRVARATDERLRVVSNGNPRRPHANHEETPTAWLVNIVSTAATEEVVAMPPPGGCARGGGQWAGTHGPPRSVPARRVEKDNGTQ